MDCQQVMSGDTKPTTTPPLEPLWTVTGIHTSKLTGLEMEDTTSDHSVAMQTLEKDLDNYDATVCTDGSTTHGIASGGSGIVVTNGPPSDPRVHRQCTLPAGKWCSSFQAEEKAVRTAFILVQDDVSLHMGHIASDSMSTLQRIKNLHPSQQVAYSDENKILDALASHTRIGCHLTLQG